jgi:hypothetical protein
MRRRVEDGTHGHVRPLPKPDVHGVRRQLLCRLERVTLLAQDVGGSHGDFQTSGTSERGATCAGRLHQLSA